MRGIVVETETPVAFHRRDRALSRGEIKGDLRRMHLEGEVDVDLVKGVEDRAEAPGEILKPLFPVILRGGRERIERVPDAGAGEAIDHRRTTRRRLPAGLEVEEITRAAFAVTNHFSRGAAAHALGIAVAPHIGRTGWTGGVRQSGRRPAWPTR